MATFSGTKARIPVQITESPSGLVAVSYGSVDITVAAVLGDVYQFCKIPADAVVLGGYLYGTNIDTAGAMAINLGTATSPTMLASGLVLNPTTVPAYKGELGILLPFQGLLQTATPFTNAGPQLSTAEQFIQAVVTVAPTTPAAGRLSVVVYYTKNFTQSQSL